MKSMTKQTRWWSHLHCIERVPPSSFSRMEKNAGGCYRILHNATQSCRSMKNKRAHHLQASLCSITLYYHSSHLITMITMMTMLNQSRWRITSFEGKKPDDSIASSILPQNRFLSSSSFFVSVFLVVQLLSTPLICIWALIWSVVLAVAAEIETFLAHSAVPLRGKRRISFPCHTAS